MTNKIVRLLAGLCFLLVLFKLAGDESFNLALSNIRNIDVSDWVLLVSISVAIIVQLALLFLISIRVVDKDIPFKVAFLYTAMNSFFNNVLPLKGGLWIRGMFLKRYFDLAWKRYLFLVVTSQLLHIAVLSLLFFSCVFFVGLDFGFSMPFSSSATYGLAVLCLTLVCVGIWLLRSKPIVERVLSAARTGLAMWLGAPKRLAIYLIMAIIFHALTALRLWYCFVLIGYTFEPLEMAALYTSLAIGLSWGFTPGNIGIKEAAVVVLATALGAEASTALTASIIDRIASLVVIAIVGGGAAYLSAQPQRDDNNAKHGNNERVNSKL